MTSQNPITPKALTVRSGTTVTWLNKDSTAHRIISGTFEMGPTNIFSSDNFESGENYTLRTNAPGVYKFFDPTSSNINGTLTVIGKTLGKAIESTTRGIGGGQPIGGQPMEDNQSEDNQSEDNQSEDNQSEDNQSEDNQSEDNQSEDNQSEDNQSEDNQSEDKQAEYSCLLG